jgi:hypothetical protein
MLFLSGRIKHPLDVTIKRPHHAYPGEHRWAAALGNEQKRFHRGLPFLGIVFGLGELRDVLRRVPLPQIRTINQLDFADWP